MRPRELIQHAEKKHAAELRIVDPIAEERRADEEDRRQRVSSLAKTQLTEEEKQV